MFLLVCITLFVCFLLFFFLLLLIVGYITCDGWLVTNKSCHSLCFCALFDSIDATRAHRTATLTPRRLRGLFLPFDIIIFFSSSIAFYFVFVFCFFFVLYLFVKFYLLLFII